MRSTVTGDTDTRNHAVNGTISGTLTLECFEFSTTARIRSPRELGRRCTELPEPRMSMSRPKDKACLQRAIGHRLAAELFTIQTGK